MRVVCDEKKYGHLPRLEYVRVRSDKAREDAGSKAKFVCTIHQESLCEICKMRNVIGVGVET